MSKNLKIVFSVLGWLAGIISFYIGLNASGIPEIYQVIILGSLFYIGIAVFAFLKAKDIGKEIGIEIGKEIGKKIGIEIGKEIGIRISKELLPKPPELPGQYFIGIDLGRLKIKYCLIDYNKFKNNPNSPDVKIVKDREENTPQQIGHIYQVLGKIIADVSQQAKDKNVHQIDGLGLGLPGQVNPKEGILIRSPGFPNIVNLPFTDDFSRHIRTNLQGSIQHPEILRDDFRIKIDNDVRCATRYLWKRMRFDDGICIFVGNGLGSGIVLGNQMLYGHDFMAGEIGHTTICSMGYDLLRGDLCKCEKEGHHWEMYCSSYGMINIAKKLNFNEYDRLKHDYATIKQKEEYQRLLEESVFKEHSSDHFDKNGELTSYFFSLAFHAGEHYACEVVKKYIKYLAIGIANYINVINPQIIYLGGGMIEGFYTDKGPINTGHLLHTEVEKYILPSASRVTIKKLEYEERTIANIGAAFIFKDLSYFNYQSMPEREKP
ncbi:MAG: ROK family protein [Candidatus Aminicenantales bacterium]